MAFFLHKNNFFFVLAESCCGFIIDRWGRVGEVGEANPTSGTALHLLATSLINQNALVWTEYSNDEIGSAGGDGWRGVTRNVKTGQERKKEEKGIDDAGMSICGEAHLPCTTPHGDRR